MPIVLNSLCMWKIQLLYFQVNKMKANGIEISLSSWKLLRYIKKTNYFKLLKENYTIQKRVETPGIEPGASNMQSLRSTTELRPHYTRNTYCAYIKC